MERKHLIKIIDWFLVIISGLLLVTLNSWDDRLFISSLNLLLPGVRQFLFLLGVLGLSRFILSMPSYLTAIASGISRLKTHKFFQRLAQYDLVLLTLSRPLLIPLYFLTEGYFLYQWDDQEGYFLVAQGLARLAPIEERFTFGLPALLLPFFAIFKPERYTDIVLPFSIVNAFFLGALSIYLVFKITCLLTNNRNVARFAALMYSVHPFVPSLAQHIRNDYERWPIFFGDMVGWNMTSDHVSVVFLLLGIFLFLRALDQQKSLLLPGVVAGYAGLIRMPTLLIIAPLFYLAFLKHRKIKDYVVFCLAVFVVLIPQLFYNWRFFGNPLTFGYTALEHLKGFWDAEMFLNPQELTFILQDHYHLIILALLALFFRPDRKTGLFVLGWVLGFVIYYSGYEAFYNDPVRFLLPLRPALCISIGYIITFGNNAAKRWFFRTGLILFIIIASHSHLLMPLPTLPAALLMLCLLFTLAGQYLGIGVSAIFPLYLYSLLYLSLSHGAFLYPVLFTSAALLLNALHGRWRAMLSRLFGDRGELTFQRFKACSTFPELWNVCWTCYRTYSLAVIGILLLGVLWSASLQDRPGLQGHYYPNPSWEGEPAVARLDSSPYVAGKEGENILNAPAFSVTWHGWITLPKSGIYRFATESDDGSFLRIDGKTIVDNGGAHGLRKVTAEVTLQKGLYPLEIQYFQIGGYSVMRTFWTPPAEAERFLPSEVLYATRPHLGNIFWRSVRPAVVAGIRFLSGLVLLMMGLALIACLPSLPVLGPLSIRITTWIRATGIPILQFRLYRTFSLLFLGLLLAATLGIGLFSIYNTWGLQAEYYQNPNWEGSPALSRIDKFPYLKGEAGENRLAAHEFSVRWHGWIVIDTSGTYTFATHSDDGSYLRIDGQTVVDNGGKHGLQKISGELELQRGVYPIEALYFQAGGFSFMQTLWSSPGRPERPIPADVLFVKPPATKDIIQRTILRNLSHLLKFLWATVFVMVSAIIVFRPVKS